MTSLYRIVNRKKPCKSQTHDSWSMNHFLHCCVATSAYQDLQFMMLGIMMYTLILLNQFRGYTKSKSWIAISFGQQMNKSANFFCKMQRYQKEPEGQLI